MRTAFCLIVLFTAVLPIPLLAEKHVSSTQYQIADSLPGGWLGDVKESELALDANGGREKCYLYGPPDPTNINHLWTMKPVGGSVMFVSRVDGMALDANGGRGNPYPRAADAANINQLWILATVGNDTMLWSKVSNVVLDANGGRGLPNRPYLSANPDPRNVNHLWSLRKVGEDYMIVAKVRRPVTVGGFGRR